MLCVQDVLSLEKQRVGGTKRDRKTKKVFLSSYSSFYRNFVFNAMQDFFGLFSGWKRFMEALTEKVIKGWSRLLHVCMYSTTKSSSPERMKENML